MRAAGARACWPLLIVVASFLANGCGNLEVSDELRAPLMERWNAVARGVTFEQTLESQTRVEVLRLDFVWQEFDRFPHPTYKHGSQAAYRTFADLLLRFFATGDNFDFLARHHLFESPLRYVFPGGQSSTEWSFEELALDMASQTNWAGVSPATQQQLRSYWERMQ